jgi:hypothetical protein
MPLGTVVPDPVDPHDVAVDAELHRIGDDAHLRRPGQPLPTQ